MQPEVRPAQAGGGLTAGLRGLDGATDACDGAANLICLEQGSVDHKAAHAGIEQLRNLRRKVDGVGVVQA